MLNATHCFKEVAVCVDAKQTRQKVEKNFNVNINSHLNGNADYMENSKRHILQQKIPIQTLTSLNGGTLYKFTL